ncbi:uncharacterized protein LOC144544549 [Carex rostrata]
MKYIKPQALFLELCESSAGEEMFPQKVQVATIGHMVDMWKGHYILPADICSIWSSEKNLPQQGAAPKSEFRIAYEEAISHGATVYLGDRPVHITNSRVKAIQSRIPLWSYAKFWYCISLLGIEDITKPRNFIKYVKRIVTWSISAELKTRPDLSAGALEEHKIAFPFIWETILTERDMFMSRKLWDAAREHSLVVAVVGQAHLPGIKKYWAQPIEVEHLLEIPKTREGTSNAKILVAVGALIGILIWARN